MHMALPQFDEVYHTVFSWQDSCTAKEISHFISIEQIPLVTKLNQEVCTLIPISVLAPRSFICICAYITTDCHESR